MFKAYSLWLFLSALPLISFLLYLYNHYQWQKLNLITTYNNTGFYSKILGRFQSTFNTCDVMQAGYEKHRGRLFKILGLGGWRVVVTSSEHINDLRKASDSMLSFQDAISDFLQMEHTLGKSLHDDPYQVGVLRAGLTRNIERKFSEMKDEIDVTLKDLIPVTEGMYDSRMAVKLSGLQFQTEWIPVKLSVTGSQIVARSSTRFLSGLSLCRTSDFIELIIKFSSQVVVSAYAIRLFPQFLKPLVSRFLTPIPGTIKEAEKHLSPIIEEYLAKEQLQSSDDSEKPEYLVHWLLKGATVPSRRSTDDLVRRILAIYFGSIHTTTMALNVTLSCLALYSDYVEELRAEIISVLEEDGWSKVAMSRMHKLDSFLKESQRFVSYAAFALERKVIKDFTFSDRTVVPAGVNIGVPMRAIHHDNEYFPDARTFDGFRFLKMGQEDNATIKHQMTTPHLHFLLFGNGDRHMCPGRFFAVNQIKAIVAQILLTYDLKLKEGRMPNLKWYGQTAVQDGNAIMLFRKRS